MLDPKMKIMSSLSKEIYAEGLSAFRIPVRAWYVEDKRALLGYRGLVSEDKWNPLHYMLLH